MVKTSDWLTEGFRFTHFPSAPFERTNWWLELIGEPPDEERTNPKSGLFQQTGQFHNGSLILSQQPNRIDWNWSPVAIPEFNYPSLGTFEECLPLFGELVKNWMPMSPPTSRVAFGPVLLLPVPSRSEGYGQLTKFLNLNFDFAGAKEFSLQINRPRAGKTEIEGLTLNRFTTWSLLKLKQLELHLDGVSSKFEGQELLACRLQQDINNAPTAVPLPGEHLAGLVSELFLLAEEIAVKGDCK